MRDKLSKCRNCACLHYFEDYHLESDYPTICYCPQLDTGMPRCYNYAPSDNLEYLEWAYEKKLEIR